MIDSMIAPDFTSEDVQASIQQHYSYKSASQRVTNSLMQMVVDSTDKSKSNIPVVEVQCKITESEYITQFEKILGKGYTEICFVTSRIPTPDLVKLVDQYEEQIAGFVLADARSDSQFLGKKVWSHTELNEIKDVDCLLIHECEVEAFMYAVKTKLPFYLTQSCPYNLSHVQNVLKELQSFSDSENGYTTLSSGLVNAKSYSQGQCIQDSHKSMVLLRGSEDDFQLYKQLKGSRQKGLVVRSVKWSDEELRAPEVFRMRVEQLNGARYAIYGNGFHTQRLLQFSGITHTPQFIFDDHAVVNELSHGIPVVHPNELSPKVAASLHSIFISSKQYEKEMFDQSLIFLPESINRVRFYHSLEQIIL
ncbi:MAG: hypothetical protein P1U42_02985 [Phycisphaerales bacterium]|nr:hypothetical protein [Phycisphaerales bacterium]